MNDGIVLYGDAFRSHPCSDMIVRYRIAREGDLVHHVQAAAGTNKDRSPPLLGHALVVRNAAVKKKMR